MEARLFWFMDIGPRDTQEDCVMFEDIVKQVDQGQGSKKIISDSFIAAICDGLGGHDAGEVASRFFCDNLVKLDPSVICSVIDEELMKIQNKSIDMIPSSCGTTIAGVIKHGDRLFVFNAGDSRVYHMKGQLFQVSHDHSYVQDLVDNEYISEEDAIGHPYRNVVTFGMGPVFQNKESDRRIFLQEVMIRRGEGVLICSDGIYESIGHSAIAEALSIPESGGDRLVKLLFDNGMRDNSSFVYVWFQ